MAKRRQTTGLPKAKKADNVTAADETSARSATPRPLREYRSRAEREAEIQRYVILGTGAAVVLIALVLLVAFISDRVILPGRVVATVNGTSMTVADFQQRVRLERVISSERISAAINDVMEMTGLPFDQIGEQVVSFPPYSTLWQELNTPDVMGLRVLNDMIDDQLVRREAEQRGITVSQEEIDAQIEQIFSLEGGLFTPPSLEAEVTPEAEVTDEPEPSPTPTPFVSPTPSPVPSPTNTPEVEPTPTLTPFPTVEPPPTLSPTERAEIYQTTLEDFYRIARSDAGMSREEVNHYFEILALREALGREVVEAEATEVWVNSRHILVELEEDARDILAALQAGESFAELARAVGTDGTAAQGGELGWAAVSNYVQEFADAVRDAPIGEIIGPVQSQFGFHVVQVSAREDRDLDESQIDEGRREQFAEWLSERRVEQDDQIDIQSIWVDYVPSTPPWRYRPR